MKKSLLILIFCLFFVQLISDSTSANFEYNYKIIEPQDTKGALNNIKEKTNVIFIIDYSNSMNEKIGEKTKLELAVDTVSELMEKIPDNVNVGLRVYGYNSGFTYLIGCTSSKLFVPLGTGNKGQIASTLNSLNASGWTPITYSLKQAVNKDFLGVSGKKHIVLLTDGGENCDESPCTYAISLMQLRDDISIDVIAFDLNDYEARNQLRCTALATRGKYFEAKNKDELKDSLFKSLNVDTSVKGEIKVKPSLF